MANGTLKVSNIQTSSGSGTITIGQSGETISIPSGCTITNSGTSTNFGEITVADMWRTTGTQNISASTSTVVTGYWTQNSNITLGSSMSESSGVWTFPTTGIYLVNFTTYIYDTTSTISYIGNAIQLTTNNSSYSNNAFCDNHFDAQIMQNSVQTYVDITDVSTHKVRFRVEGADSFALHGGSESKTYAQFIRLGNT
jgi:hypothetical protein